MNSTQQMNGFSSKTLSSQKKMNSYELKPRNYKNEFFFAPKERCLPIVFTPPPSKNDLLYRQFKQRMMQNLTQKSSNRSSLVSCAQSKNSRGFDLPLQKPTPSLPQQQCLSIKSIRKSPQNLKIFKNPGLLEEHGYITDKYSLVLPHSFTSHDLTFDKCNRADQVLLVEKAKFFSNLHTEYKLISYRLDHLPFFLNKLVYINKHPKNTPLPLILKGDNLLHFITTHKGRRMCERLPEFYHLHREWIELLYPKGFVPLIADIVPEYFECKYYCGQFYQTCHWHAGKPYDQTLLFRRQLLYNLLCKLNLLDSASFFLSLFMAFNDKTAVIYTDKDQESYTPPEICSLQVQNHDIPDCRLMHIDRSQWWKDEEPLQVAQADLGEKKEDPSPAILPIKDYNDIPYPNEYKCIICNVANMSRDQFQTHLLSNEHQLKTYNEVHNPPVFVAANEPVRDCSNVELMSPPTHLPVRVDNGYIPPAENETPENPVFFSREYISSKLSDLLTCIGDVTDSLPQWIREHTRFIINLVCNCVNIMFSKAWINVIASISAIINEVCHEFPDLIKTKVHALTECFKQVIWKYFPHAQAASTMAQDDKAANESFIVSLFAIVKSLIPGVSVESGLLKARIQKIKDLSFILTSARTIGQWFCTLFEKLWTWIQIYYYGATSEQIARQKALLNSPDIQVWVNDVMDFEVGKKKEDGTFEPACITRILTDTELQDRVIELKTRGDEFLKTATLGDSLKNSRLVQLIQHNLRKVDRWYKMFEDSRGLVENKHEPFVIYLYGDPGVGKTYCVNYLCQALATACGRTFEPARDIFTKPRDSEHHDGYNSQFCYLLDDFFQVITEQGNASEVSFLIDAGSRAKHHLHMAGVEKKAASYFVSPLVMLTSNKVMSPQSFDTKVISFGALARRIDLMIEVRRRPNWKPDPTKVFDPSGMFFRMFEFEFDSTRQDGMEGDWVPLCEPVDWGTLATIASTLFVKKLRHQATLDKMDVPNPGITKVTADMIGRYASSTLSKQEVAGGIISDRCVKVENAKWPTMVVNRFTNQKQEEKLAIAGLVVDDQCLTSVGSEESITSLEIREELASVAEEEIVPQAACEHPTQRPLVDQLIESAQLEHDDEYGEMQVAQAEGYDFLPCVAKDCDRCILRTALQADVFRHLLRAAREHNVYGDAHCGIPACDVLAFLGQFPAPMNRHDVPLEDHELEWYEHIQFLYHDYQPRGSPWSLNDLLVEAKYDMVRALIMHYRTYEHRAWLLRVAYAPYYLVQRVASGFRRLVKNSMESFWAPVKPVLDAVESAKTALGSIASGLKSVAIIGVLLASISSVFALCYMKWYIQPNPDKSVSFTMQKNDNGSWNITSPARKQEAFVSGDLRTNARKKRIQRVENATEAFVSADLSTHAKKRVRKQRVECRYVSKYDVFSYSPELTTIRVRPSTKHDVRIDIRKDGDEAFVDFLWCDGTEESITCEWSKKDVEITNRLEEKMLKFELPELAPLAEAKKDRMELVESQIGKIPIQEAEAARDPCALDLMKHLSPSLFKVTNLDRGITLNGFFIKDRIGVMPLHVLADKPADGVHLRIITTVGSFDAILGKKFPYVVVAHKDTLLVDLSGIPNLTSHRNLAKSFLREKDEIKTVDGYLYVMQLPTAVNGSSFVLAKSLLSIYPIERRDYAGPDRDSIINVVGALAYRGDSESGDCGSLIVRCDTYSPRKLMGFHVAGSKGEGTGIIWTEEMFEEELAHFQVAQGLIDVSFVPLDEEEFFECESTEVDGLITYVPTKCELLGMMEKSVLPGAPLTTKLQPSPLWNKVIETKSGPSTTRPFINSAGEKKEPLKIALSKLESPSIVFDEVLVEKATKAMITDYVSRGYLEPYGQKERGKLSIEENIKGVDQDDWIKPINMKTSPGFPYVLAGDKRTYLDPETLEVNRILKEAFEERERKAKDGIEVPALMVDVLKDERLSNDKREKGKVRIFNVCPLDFNMLVRKYYTRFLAQMMDRHLQGEVAVGINPHGDDWEALYTNLQRRGSHWLAGDYSAWDKRAPIQIALAGLQLVETFYKQFGDYEESDAIVRKVLLKQAFQSIRLSQVSNKGLIYRVHQSMPSGIAITAVYNSIINSLLFRVIFCELAEQNGWRRMRALNTYLDHVAFTAYGDDHVARVSEEVYPWFNMLTISQQMEKHNITYTAATKGEITGPEVLDEDLTYLKRRFVKRGARMDAPMELDSVLDILNWVNATNPADVKEASESAIKSVLIELSHHDRKTFKHWFARIFEAAVQSGLKCPVVDYDEVIATRRSLVFDYGDDFY